MKEIQVSPEFVALIRDGITIIKLYIDQPESILWLDRDENLWKKAKACYKGDRLQCRDWDGFQWESPIEELKTEARPIS